MQAAETSANQSPSGTISDQPSGKHIVEELIEERAEKLVRSKFWPIYKSILYPVLKHRKAVRMADAIATLSGHESMRHVSNLLSLDVRPWNIDRVPENGRVLIAATHPTGIADGVAMYDALKQRRPDMIFFANRDAIRVSPYLEDILIPVERVAEKRTRQRSRETLIATKKAFLDERCVVLFPSGRLAFMDDGKVLTEQVWMNSVAIFARKYDCAVLPVNVKARNSWMYYWFWRLSTELRDITLFNELLNKRGKPFDITFGNLIEPDQLSGDPNDVAAALRAHAINDVPNNKPWLPIADDLSQ